MAKMTVRDADRKALMAIGIFMGVFGMALVYASFITETRLGAWTNVGSAAVLLIVAGFCIMTSRRLKNKAES
ncbi:hypothetical protein GF406_21180 [candidate division KSB1 bacterium]|nr:hypothetical protein [candidate division KSB1 bacterium]